MKLWKDIHSYNAIGGRKVVLWANSYNPEKYIQRIHYCIYGVRPQQVLPLQQKLCVLYPIITNQ